MPNSVKRIFPPALLMVCVATVISAVFGNEDEKVLASAGIPSDEKSLIDFLSRRSRETADKSQIKLLISKLGDDSFEERELASARLCALGMVALADLKQASDSADVEIARRSKECIQKIDEGARKKILSSVVRTLGSTKSPTALKTLMNYAPYSHEDRTFEDLVLAMIQCGKDDATALKEIQMNSTVVENDWLKVAAGCALVKLDQEKGRQSADNLLKLRDPHASFEMGLALAGLGEVRGITAMATVMDRLDPWEFSLTDHLLRKLTRAEKPPTNLSNVQTKENWLKIISNAEWKPTSQEITKASSEVGKTLVVLLDAGKIQYMDRNNQVLWSIDGLQFPLDAQIIDTETVLVAEHQGNRVTRRDRKNQIVWEKKIDGPLASHRLEDGSTFIANKNEIQIVAEDGKTISTFTPANGEIIMRASPLNNGEMCVILSTPQGNNRCVVLDKGQKEKSSFEVDVRTSGGKVSVLANGNVIITEVYGNRVVEYNPAGKEVWHLECEQPVAATRLANGNTLVTSMTQLRAFEINPKGKEVWSYKSDTRVTRAFRQ